MYKITTREIEQTPRESQTLQFETALLGEVLVHAECFPAFGHVHVGGVVLAVEDGADIRMSSPYRYQGKQIRADGINIQSVLHFVNTHSRVTKSGVTISMVTLILAKGTDQNNEIRDLARVQKEKRHKPWTPFVLRPPLYLDSSFFAKTPFQK